MPRNPIIRASLSEDLVVDSFAGGGGASTGIEAALDGRPVDIAINHDAEAIAMHRANHPETRHYQEDIWEVDPAEACSGRRVGLAWFSPACTHFSRAKGSANPLCEKIRGLAWVVIRWAKSVRPRVIVVENVEEFRSWGPLGDDGRPVSAQQGETFRAWLAELRGLGYAVDIRTLVAADYGTPTIRKRLFVIARCDGAAVVWPEATHGSGRPEHWRPASDVIDWSLPCPSIFERKRPLAEATLKRIATGIRRYVIESSDPFIIPLTHQGDSRAHSIREPVRTITGAHRGELALVNPFVVRHGHYSTITGAGLRDGCGAGTFRGQPLDAPLATVCATNDKHLVCPMFAKGSATESHREMTVAFLTKFYGTSTGSELQLPLPTVTANGRGGGHLGLVTVRGDPYQIVDIGMRMLQPHELFAAQGFPDDYEIAPMHNGKPLTKTAQTSLAGNSVCPQVARAIVEANVRRAA